MERYHIFKLGLAIIFYAAYCIRPMMVNGLKINDAASNSNNQTQKKLPDDDYFVFYQGVQGKPGVDFPVLSYIPRTAFSCRGLDSGYYADLDTDCQVFHICEDGKKISFLCPNGTIFQQSELICEWWFKVNCANSPNLYEESAEQLREENARRKANRRVAAKGEASHGAVMRTEEHSSISASQNGRRYEVKPAQKASKRVFTDNSRINNHSPTYKANTAEDAAKIRPNSNNFNQPSLITNGNQRVRISVSSNYQNNRQSNVVSNQNTLGSDKDSSRRNSNTNRGNNFQRVATQTRFGDDLKDPESSIPARNNNFQRTATQARFGDDLEDLENQTPTRNSNEDNNFQKITTQTRFNDDLSSPEREIPARNSNKYEGTRFVSELPKPNSGIRENPKSQSITRGDVKFGSSALSSIEPNDLLLNRFDNSDSGAGKFVSSTRTPFSNTLKTQNYSPLNSISSSTPAFSFESSTKPSNYEFGQTRRSSFVTPSTTLPPLIHRNFNNKNELTTPSALFNLGNVGNNQEIPKEFGSNLHANTNQQSPAPTQIPNSKTFNVDSKISVNTQKSTVPLTRNDILNRRLEPNESDESQIPQETASFYKNSLNSIHQTYKSSTQNPYPNHKSTYSDIKEPKYYLPTTKFVSGISSVTPQYLTTQPINRGKPFIGSQVGTTVRGNFGIGATTQSSVDGTRTDNQNYLATTDKNKTNFYGGLFNVGQTDQTSAPIKSESTTVSIPVPTELFNIGKTDEAIATFPPGTTPTTSTRYYQLVTVPPTGTFNLGNESSSKIETSTRRVVDHATVYGKFVKSSPTTPSPLQGRKIQVQFNGNSLDVSTRQPNPLSTDLPKISTFSQSGSVSTTIRDYNSVSTTTPAPSTSNQFNGFFVTKNSGSSRPSFSITTPITSSNYNLDLTTTPSPNFVYDSFKQSDILKPRPFQLPPERDIVVTPTQSSSLNTVTYPTYKISSAGPFSLPVSTKFSEQPTPAPTLPTPFTTRASFSSSFENVDNMINALVDMANPNKDHSSETPRPGLVIPPSVGPQTLHTLARYFANALDGIAVGNDDLEENNTEEPLSDAELEKKRLTALLTQMTMNRYNELFNDDKEPESETESTTITTRLAEDEKDNSDLEGQHSKNPAQTPRVRQLARVFTQALSSYLDDPDTFKRVLEEIRPTEPPPLSLDTEETTEIGTSEDELLNFSDADSKSSYPPFFPTLPSVHPTWSYLVAFNTTQFKANNDLDVKNSLTPESENLQLADSQSFVSQYNNLNSGLKSKKIIETDTINLPVNSNLPENHWTSSPGVTKLWASTFSVNPASINQNFETTETIFTTTTQEEAEDDTSELPIQQPHHEIKYELRALPKLALNSTQVHGILIDFMNTTKTDSGNRLVRILKKLNTTEDEFLAKMKEIEANPLTRRLILLLISECGTNASKEINAEVVPLHSLIDKVENERENLQPPTRSSSDFDIPKPGKPFEKSSNGFQDIVDPSLSDDDQDSRALQLLNSLYSIASKFGK